MLVTFFIISLFFVVNCHLNTINDTEWDHSLPAPNIYFGLEQEQGRFLDRRTRRRLAGDGPPYNTEVVTPLYQGFGVHFSYIWVGTPPQRVSVIVDTGSHFTAFPCKGCSCGKHEDPFWDPDKSSTSKIEQCQNKRCTFSQSYTEGSSWKAYKVRDLIWMGGNKKDMIAGAEKWSFEFSFGCQSSETGLFRTQNVDGIMGMSASEDTFPFSLYRNKITSTRIFAMCFSVGGGMLTLGGVDQSIHTSPVQYANKIKDFGWYTVRLLEMSMLDPIGNTTRKLHVPTSSLNTGKGAIVDSGTTDTYLPSSIRAEFTMLFRKISGISYSNTNIHISRMQYLKLPDIYFTLEGKDGTPFTITMPATSYVEQVSKGKYAFRIYLTEDSGVVLGGNFMNGMNVIFDQDNGRIGFAKSSCQYASRGSKSVTALVQRGLQSFSISRISQNTSDGKAGSGTDCQRDRPLNVCSATCDSASMANQSGYEVMYSPGTQLWVMKCSGSSKSVSLVSDLPAYLANRLSSLTSTQSLACHVPCVSKSIVEWRSECTVGAWSDCDGTCTQQRDVGRPTKSGCVRSPESRACAVGKCPLGVSDRGLAIELAIRGLTVAHWSYARSNDIIDALASLVSLGAGSIRILAPPTYVKPWLHLHIRVRVTAADWNRLFLTAYQTGSDQGDVSVSQDTKISTVLDGMLSRFKDPSSQQSLLSILHSPGRASDWLWLDVSDISVLSANKLPLPTAANNQVSTTIGFQTSTGVMSDSTLLDDIDFFSFRSVIAFGTVMVVYLGAVGTFFFMKRNNERKGRTPSGYSLSSAADETHVI